jgi:hypothetical protein
MWFPWRQRQLKQALKKGRPRRRGTSLKLEVLEDRTVLSFFTSPTFATGLNPHGLAVGDFNGDGHADVAVANQSSNTVSILLGNGDGTFQPKTDFATGTGPVAVAARDFNGDGKLDLAVINSGSNSLSILLGNGDGTFQAKTDTTLPITPQSLTVGDFNGDGKVDIVVGGATANTADMTVMLGNGNGTFQAPVTTVTATVAGTFVGGAVSVQNGDFNGDGRADLVVVNNLDTTSLVAVRFGFTTVHNSNPGTASVFLGNGDGTFQAPNTLKAGTSPGSVAVGDFNGDGRLDFAVNGGSLTIFSNSNGGNFSASLLSGSTGGTVTAGDFNGDGITDLFTTSKVFDGSATTAPQLATTYAVGLLNPIAADVNGDGHADLIGIVSSGVQPWLNMGNGTFLAPSYISSAGVTFSLQANADFNGDGIPDVVSSNGQVASVSLGLGDGRFGDTISLPLPFGSFIAAVDADGNGTPDITANGAGVPTGQAEVWFNSPGYDNRTGSAVSFVVSAPTQITAGSNSSITVTAVDALGNPVSNFLGTVDLDFTPAGSTALNLAGQYTYTAADNGRHTFLFSNVTQAGAGTLFVFAVGMPTATSPLNVVPAALNKFAFAAPSSIPAGTPFSFTIIAEDKFNNVETDYTGTVHFSALANDTQAVLPADYTFTAVDAGTHTFGATLFKTAGASAPFINAKDLTTGVNTSGAVVITALAPVALSATSLPSPYTAGTVVGVTVAAVDTYGNRATGYTGTIHVSSSDALASLPSDLTITAANGGTATFVVALKTAGTQSFSVADTVNPAFASTQSNIVVTPAAASVFAFTGLPSSTMAGTSQSFLLTTFDAFGNRAPYFGTVVFSSTDSQALLPQPYGFTAADAGSHVFSATLGTAGLQSLTARDAFNGAPVGSQAIAVTPAAAASLTVAGFPATTTAGVAHSFTVTARDAFGNVATGYTGTVTFSSSDPIASLPAAYSFTAGDAGVHTFTAALKRAGTQFIQVSDTLTPGVAGAESSIAVSAAAVSQFAINGPATVTKGVGFKITVSAVDAFGNVNSGYRGAVRLSTTDATGGTQNFTFSNNDNGVHIFSYTFNALGFQTITIADTANGSILGSLIVDVLAQTAGGGGAGGGAA